MPISTNTANSINTAWNIYRGWSARARAMKMKFRRFNLAALVCAVAAAIFGAMAAFPLHDMGWFPRGASLLAAIAAGLVPLLGREILSTSLEKKWLAARGVAETIKAECYRYAGGVAPYDAGGDAARGVFRDKLKALLDGAAQDGLVGPTTDDVSASNYESQTGTDSRCPIVPMTADWYLTHRLDDQYTYYIRNQSGNEQTLSRLRLASLIASGFGVIAGVIGATTSNGTAFATAVGACVTGAAALMAYGLLDQRSFLAASYGATANMLRMIKGFGTWSDANLAALVDQTEAAIAAEQGIWAQRIAALRKADPEANGEGVPQL
jgi:SMODS and SLOG-associating 2TM effector domain 1/Protein of unknown function (DUF4231)